MIDYLFQTPAGQGLADLLSASSVELHVPELCDIETCSVLRRALLTARISEERAFEALEDYLDLPLHRHGHRQLVVRVLELRPNFTCYDAAYVALSERLDARLLTTDVALARAVAEAPSGRIFQIVN